MKQLQALKHPFIQRQGDMASHGTFSRPRTVKVSNIPEGRVLGKDLDILRASSKENAAEIFHGFEDVGFSKTEK